MAETGDEAFADVSRDDCLEAARAYAADRRAAVRQRHNEGESGFNVITQLSGIADVLLKGVFSFALYQVRRRQALMKRISLCALGGYGRAQLNPHSDLDVCVLYKGRLDKNIEKLNKYLIPFLWDIGYENSYVVRSVDEAIALAKEDTRVYTSYLECRLLMGSGVPFAKLRVAIQALSPGDTESSFAQLKLREREAASGGQRGLYSPQPNVKDGAGGLRDYHAGLWLFTAAFGASTLDEIEGRGMISVDDRLELASALDLIWRIRNELHFHAGKCEDRLTVEFARHVAEAFGYTDESERDISHLMADYYAAARKLHKFLRLAARVCAPGGKNEAPDLTASEDQDLVVEDGELYLPRADTHWFAENPARLMSVFWECARRDVVVNHQTERAIKDNLDLVGETFRSSDLVRRFFLAICNRPYQAGKALRQAAEAGLLPLYLPEFSDVEDIIRYEDFHRYPVDEHTLRAIEALALLPDMEGSVGSFLKTAMEHLTDPYILVLALLFHDLGKASGEDHSEEGVRLAYIIGERVGLAEEDTERIAFLVKHHLLMTNIALYRDTDDIDIIENFARTMKSEDRLRALFLLSYADMSAVAPNVWNDWKGTLLRKLYLKTEKVLSGRAETIGEEFWKTPRAEKTRDLLPASAKDGLEDHLKALGDHYLAAFTPPQIVVHVDCLREADKDGFAVRTETNEAIDMTEVVVCSPDHRGLFEELAGCFASQLIDIQRAALFTRPDGMALDCFTVVNAAQQGPLSRGQVTVLKRVLRRVLQDRESVDELLEKSDRRIFAVLQTPLPVPTRIAFDNDSSRAYTVVDVESADRTGLLYDVTQCMNAHDIDIASARIVTDAGRARDAFYVTLNGKKIEDESRLAEIREALVRAIHPRPAAELKGGVL